MLLIEISKIGFLFFLHMHDNNSIIENKPVINKAIFVIRANKVPKVIVKISK